jgi:ribosomal protein L11 methyltransferase
MQDYYQYKFIVKNPEHWNEILIAELESTAMESFMEEEDGFCAYSTNGNIDTKIKTILNNYSELNFDFEASYQKTTIPYQNWNEEWEKNFNIVEIDDWCVIKAPFHELEKNYDQTIIVAPKMSFGTGHHPTTYLMMKAMKSIDFKQKSVLDMGSGTGILSILAYKLGSKNIDAIDIEEWAFENCKENAELNNCSFNILLGNETVVPQKNYNIILANINKNILLHQMNFYYNHLEQNGTILVSGILSSDEKEIIENFKKIGFKFLQIFTKENWLCIQFEK